MLGRRKVVVVVMVLAGLVAQTGHASAATQSPLTVTVAASSTSQPAGKPVVLTATANRDVAGSGQLLEVVDRTSGVVMSACASGSTCVATVTQAGPSSRSYAAQAAAAANGSGATATSSALSVSWTGGTTQTGDPVIAAAGDIACDPADSNASGANPSTCQMAATARQIGQLKPAYVLPLGDTQYALNAVQGQAPTTSQFSNGYGASWGQLQSTVPGVAIRPTPGNHEWGDANESQAQPLNAGTYFKYFAGTLPSGVTAAKDWYSFDVPVAGGTWHIVSIDSECGAVGGCGTGSAEESWLRADLQAHPNQCIAAYWHEPRFSTGFGGNDPRYDALWQDLYAAHAALVLNGHDHSYERFVAQNPAGTADPAGITEFVVGTGGVGLEQFASSSPNLAFRDGSTFGTVQLAMHAGRADFSYRTIGGATLDSGSVTCPTPAPPPPPGSPVVSSVSPVSGSSAGGTVVSISGSNLSGASAVRFGSVAAAGFSVVSGSSVTATAPAGTSTVDVTVTTAAGTSANVVGDEFSYTFANGGYGVRLSASSTSAAVGGSVSLTATSNQDVGPTPYGITIMDVSTGAQVAHVGSGTSVTVSVSQSAASTHRYVASISNAGAANPQAAADPAIITWAAPPPPPPVPVVSSVSPVSGSSAGGTVVSISGSNLSGASAVRFGSVAAAGFSVVSGSSVTATAPAGTSTVDVTVTTAAGTSANVVGDEFSYTFANGGYGVRLSASSTSAAVGGSVSLTATSNQDVGPTPYGITIMDVSTGAQVAHVGSGTSVTVSVSQSAASTHRYVASISNAGAANPQAAADPAIITWG